MPAFDDRPPNQLNDHELPSLSPFHFSPQVSGAVIPSEGRAAPEARDDVSFALLIGNKGESDAPQRDDAAQQSEWRRDLMDGRNEPGENRGPHRLAERGDVHRG